MLQSLLCLRIQLSCIGILCLSNYHSAWKDIYTLVMTVHVCDRPDFVYTPPASALGAKRILIKPNLGYPTPHPVTVSLSVLQDVIEGVRGVNATAEILIVEGVCHSQPANIIMQTLGLPTLLGDGIRFLDADTLPCKPYPNQSAHPFRFSEMYAPALLSEVDCRLSIGCIKRTMLKNRVLMSCSIKNLYGLFPRARYKARSPKSRGQLHRPDVHQIITDVYYTIGLLFDGAVIDGTEKFISKDWQPDKGNGEPFGSIIWGDDLLVCDRTACTMAGEGMPAYLDFIDQKA